MARNCLPGTAPDSCRVRKITDSRARVSTVVPDFEATRKTVAGTRSGRTVSRNASGERLSRNWTCKPGPRGSPATSARAPSADPPIATTTSRSKPSASSSSRSPTCSGSSRPAVSGRSTQPRRSSAPRAPVVPSPAGGVRSVQAGASASGRASSGRTDSVPCEAVQRLQVMVFAGVRVEETGLSETGTSDSRWWNPRERRGR